MMGQMESVSSNAGHTLMSYDGNIIIHWFVCIESGIVIQFVWYFINSDNCRQFVLQFTRSQISMTPTNMNSHAWKIPDKLCNHFWIDEALIIIITAIPIAVRRVINNRMRFASSHRKVAFISIILQKNSA